MKKLKIWLKIDIFGELALRHVNLLFQKTTVDDDDSIMRLCNDRKVTEGRRGSQRREGGTMSQ